MSTDFVIGVTGHRDIPVSEYETSKKEVRDLLSTIRGYFKSSRLCLASGLAEGADSLVTEVALELGMKVLVVLPMPKSLYEQDFKGPALEKFREITSNQHIEIVELPLTEENRRLDDDQPINRIVQYEELKSFLQRRSNLLLALWDGDVIDQPGGTSDVLIGYLGKASPGHMPQRISCDDYHLENCGDIVAWVQTSRASGKKSNPVASRFLVASSNGASYFEVSDIPPQIMERWQGLDVFSNTLSQQVADASESYSLTSQNSASISDECRFIESEFRKVDQLAIDNQKSSDKAFKLFAIIAAAMGLFFLIYAKILAAKIFLVAYILLFCFGYYAFRQTARHGWLGLHLAYRALAETYRIQFYLLHAGAARQFSAHQLLRLTSVDNFKNFEWFSEVIRFTQPTSFQNSEQDQQFESVKKDWIEDQVNYFSRKLHQMHSQHERLERIKSALLLGSVAGAAALIIFYQSMVGTEIAGLSTKSWLVFLMGLLPLWLAVWELYQSKMATRELLWQYANQRRHFVDALHQLQHLQDTDSRRKVIFHLGERALAEIYLWSMHRYHREHEPPAAG